VLAGGQSLVPLLNMRLTRPEVIVDLNHLDGLAGIAETPVGVIRIGAMTRQRALEIDPLIPSRLPILSEAAGQIAHLAIRNRGTVGGSLAHADPAAELPAVMLLLEAVLVIAARGGSQRRVTAADFFRGPFTTALQTGEILVAIEIQPPSTRTGSAFVEVSRVHGAFALVGAAALVAAFEDGRVRAARVTLAGIGGVPLEVPWMSELTRGRLVDQALMTEIDRQVAGWVEPWPDIHASSQSRRRLAGTLASRALALAAGRAGNGGEG